MRIVVRHDNDGRWWWTLVADDNSTLAISAEHTSRFDVLRAVSELKVEGPSARVVVEDAVTPPAAERARSPA